MTTWLVRICRAVQLYFVVGLVLVAVGARSFAPLRGAVWQERATTAIQRIVTWPRLLPTAGAAVGVPLSPPALWTGERL